MANNERIFFCNLKDLKPKKSVKKWLGDRLDEGVKFWNENKEFVLFVGIPVATSLIGLGKAGIKAAGKNRAVRTEIKMKNRRFYDPSLRCYWNLNHELSNSEKVMISKRRKSGEKLSDILSDMRLI